MRSLSILAFLGLAATPASADIPVVVTDTPVVHSLVSQVMGPLGAPSVLLEPGADPHSLQLRPSQARALSYADIVFWVGEALTPSLGRAFGNIPQDARIVELLDIDGLDLIDLGDAGHEDHADHGHDDEHDHDHEHDHGHHEHAGEHAHDHDHGDVDAHAWLDPENAAVWIDAIASALSSADPENAAAYTANAETAKARVEAMTQDIRDTLAPVAGRPIVVFHDAYGYFARSFGITIAGSVALGDAASPGVRRIRELEQTLSEGQVACVFREPQHDPSIAERIAREAGTGIGTLDPAGSTLPYGPDLYTSMMTGLAKNIADCVASSG